MKSLAGVEGPPFTGDVEAFLMGGVETFLVGEVVMAGAIGGGEGGGSGFAGKTTT